MLFGDPQIISSLTSCMLLNLSRRQSSEDKEYGTSKTPSAGCAKLPSISAPSSSQQEMAKGVTTFSRNSSHSLRGNLPIYSTSSPQLDQDSQIVSNTEDMIDAVPRFDQPQSLAFVHSHMSESSQPSFAGFNYVHLARTLPSSDSSSTTLAVQSGPSAPSSKLPSLPVFSNRCSSALMNREKCSSHDTTNRLMKPLVSYLDGLRRIARTATRMQDINGAS